MVIDTIPSNPVTGAAGNAPYCFVLDNSYRILTAGPSSMSNPVKPMYDASREPDQLPREIETVVRALTSSWCDDSSRANMAIVRDVQVIVAPVHGWDGHRIAVFVRRLLVNTYA